MESLELEAPSTSLLTPSDDVTTYFKWHIIYHHLRFAFSVLKFFIRIVEERASFLEIELRLNSINIPIIVFESNLPIVQNSMCTETEKKDYSFSLGGRVNFAGCHHFSDALLAQTTPTKETSPIPKSVALVLILPTMPI